MNPLSIFFFVTLLVASPRLEIGPSAKTANAVSLYVSGDGEELEQCIPSGFQLRYRIELQFCRGRSLWFSSCKDTRSLIRTLEYDAVAESFKMVSDRLGDEEEPITTTYPTLTQGMDALSNFPNVELKYLGVPDSGLRPERNYRLRTRLLSDCKGDYSQTFSRISYVLTLGLVRLSQFDTGWNSVDMTAVRKSE